MKVVIRERFKRKKRRKKLIKISFRYVRVAENFENLVFFSFFSQHTLNRQVSFTVELLDHRRWYLDLLKGQQFGKKKIMRLATYGEKKGKKLVFTGRRYV